MTQKELKKIKDFLKKLQEFKKEDKIKILYRGVEKDFAFKLLKLDSKYNSIEQFAEKLFYFGEKSKYFWEEKIQNNFSINDVSEKVFLYIFEKLKNIAEIDTTKEKTKKFVEKNQKQFDFFKKTDNEKIFITNLKKLDDNKKRMIRNYYFRIIHQLGETEYKDNSMLISSSSKRSVAENFAGKNKIIITFWDFDFNNFSPKNYNLPFFKGKPYKNQKEITIFGAIFPHYIYSFKYRGQEYYNPAIKRIRNMEETILSGLEINQENFENNLSNVNYKKGINKSNDEYSEVYNQE